MNKSRKAALALPLVVATLLPAMPQRAAAQKACTDQWAACINVAGQQPEPFRSAYDVECGLVCGGDEQTPEDISAAADRLAAFSRKMEQSNGSVETPASTRA